MIRTFCDNLEKISITKYPTDEIFYKNLWLKKYNIQIDKHSTKNIKETIKAKVVKKKYS
tara:strand:+ start:7317 stop:7493 length:177 start_codon:yes stop_codon:yes gene_type:complete